MRARSRWRARLSLIALLATAVFAAFWLGLVPQRLSPFAPLDLNEPKSWFLNFRLAALKNDAALCGAVLNGPMINAGAIPDQPIENGCGWRNAVRFSQAGGAHVSVEKMSCDLAAAFAMWMAHEVQPAAAEILNAEVKSVRHMGTYACRNIAGSASLAKFRSQHARANAIDVGAFVLSNGRSISVAKNWKGNDAEAQFLKRIHARSCRYFRVSLSPNFNAAHANHFHFDRGAFKSCR